jgi:ribonuclease-3
MTRAARKDRRTSIARVEERIGHRLATRRDRLERALTHASTRTNASGNYERLEFLGDRVLGLCVAETAVRAFRQRHRG